MKLLLVIFILFCKAEIPKKDLIANKSDTITVNFNYGVKSENPFFSTESELWKPVLQEKDGNACIFSHPSIFVENELGLSLKICSQIFGNERILLESILDGSNKSITLTHEDKIKVNSTTLSEIISNWKENLPYFILTGDRFLETERISSIIVPEYLFSLYGDEKNLNSTYSLAYFSMWKDKNYWNFAFPEEYIGGRKSSISYLVISIKDTEINLKIEEISKLIKISNTKNLENCKNDPIEFTEFIPLSSTITSKFIEWKNPNKTTICLSNFELGINDKVKINKSKTGFLLPNEVVLIGEETSKLMIHSDIQLEWKELKEDSNISFSTKDYKINYKNEFQKPIKFEEGEVSIKNNNKQCSSTIKYSKNTNLCADPGIDIFNNKNSCNTNDFRISEINFNSISSDVNSKYIELNYFGELNCDLSSVSLVIDNTYIPLSLFKKSITKNEIILLGNPEVFQNINSIKRDFNSLNLYSKVKIVNNSNIQTLYEKGSLSNEFILKSSLGISYSLIPYENTWKIHPLYLSKNIKSGFEEKIIGSPGQISTYQSQKQNGYISEINLLGSYSNVDSITIDKFIELDLVKNGNYTLVLKYINGNNISLEIPPILKNSKFIITKNKLTCFPNIEVYINDFITLTRDIIAIELYSENDLLDKLSIDNLSGFGYEDRTARVRKSYTRTDNLNYWKNSFNFSLPEYLSPICYPYTHASPGYSNSYSEYIDKSERNNEIISITRFFPSIFPMNTSNFSVYNNLKVISNQKDNYYNRSFDFSIILSPFDIDNLLFVKWLDSSDLNLLLPASLNIQAVLPLPSNIQNEWILICNKYNNYEYIKNYEVQDSTYFDKLIPYGVRFPGKNPLNTINSNFSLVKDGLNYNECGYIIDPDATNLVLKTVGTYTIPIFTVSEDSSIGNGISADESLNLYKIKQGNRVLVSNYGNQFSHNPFSIKALENEIIYLKEGKTGESIYDYRIEK
jgi:hypothetical protein